MRSESFRRLATAVVFLSLLSAACSSSADSSAEGSTVVADAPAESAEVETEAEEAEEPEAEEPVSASEEEDEPAEEPAGVEVQSVSSTERLGSYTLSDDEFGTMVEVVVEGGTRTITSNGRPDHETGTFPNDGNPNAIEDQDLSWSFTTTPNFTGGATEVRTTGVAVNGVKFEPGTGETVTCASGQNYRIEALQEQFNLGLDFNNAHVQPGGEYHYHGASELLVEAYAGDDDLVHVGFAADGFLMYYSKSNAYSASYVLSDEVRQGEDCVATGPDDPAVEVAGTSPDGTYASDWVFSEGAGDLDRCNGTTVDGQYIYVLTDQYPFISRCLNGEVQGGGQGAPAGGEGGGTGGGGPDLTDAADALGVSVEDLTAALGSPPFDVETAAATLGVTAEELEAVLPPPPGQ